MKRRGPASRFSSLTLSPRRRAHACPPHVPTQPGSAGYEDPAASYCAAGEAWEEFGFQQRNPVSDIRGGGVLCVELLAHFLRHHRPAAAAMLKGQQARSVDRASIAAAGVSKDYPFAAAAINVTRLVAQAKLGYLSPNRLCPPAAQCPVICPPSAPHTGARARERRGRCCVLCRAPPQLLVRAWRLGRGKTCMPPAPRPSVFLHVKPRARAAVLRAVGMSNSGLGPQP